MQKIFIKPTNPSVKVRKLRGGHIHELGEFVQREAYYLRRVKDGDAVLITKEKEIKAAEAQKVAEAKKAAEQPSTDKEA
jgi:hypothetical protein